MNFAPSYSKWAILAHFCISVPSLLLSACGGQIEGEPGTGAAEPGVRRDIVTRDGSSADEEAVEVWLSSDRVEEPSRPPGGTPHNALPQDQADCSCGDDDFAIVLHGPTGSIVYDLPPEEGLLPLSCEVTSLHIDPCVGFFVAACHETLGCVTLKRAAQEGGHHSLLASLPEGEMLYEWQGDFPLLFDEPLGTWSGDFSFTDTELGSSYSGQFSACPTVEPTHCREH